MGGKSHHHLSSHGSHCHSVLCTGQGDSWMASWTLLHPNRNLQEKSITTLAASALFPSVLHEGWNWMPARQPFICFAAVTLTHALCLMWGGREDRYPWDDGEVPCLTLWSCQVPITPEQSLMWPVKCDPVLGGYRLCIKLQLLSKEYAGRFKARSS